MPRTSNASSQIRSRPRSKSKHRSDQAVVAAAVPATELMGRRLAQTPLQRFLTRVICDRFMDFKADAQRMEKIVSLCKRRGFIFQSSEIYGGLNGAWDYGPLGVELKRNLKNYWWRVMVHERDDVVGMDGAILTHPAVLKASGHVEGFSDPMVDCRLTGKRFRADQIAQQSGTIFRYEFAREAAPTGTALQALGHLAETNAEPKFKKTTITSSDALDLAKRIVERRKLSISLPNADPKTIELFFLHLGDLLRQDPRSHWEEEFASAYSQRGSSKDAFSVLIRPG